MKYILPVVLFCMSILPGCAQRQHDAVPEDFSFALFWDISSSYDSETGTLIKTTDATAPEDYKTQYDLTAADRAYVYGLLSDLDASSYPDRYDPGNGRSKPSMTLKLTVRMNGTEKTVLAEDIAQTYESEDEKGQRFLSTCRAISDLLTGTDAWKALPEYEHFYR